jgi:large subunit ribosomal protein L21
MEYAIIRTGGKQYRVTPGDVIDVEKLPDWQGPSVELTDVLLLNRDGKLTVGTPTVSGVKVRAEMQSQVKGDKVTIGKYRRKTRYRRKQGHRQVYSRLAIKGIEVEGEESAGEVESDGTQEGRRKQPQRKRQQRQTARRKAV